MLTKQECSILNNFHCEDYGYGVSPVDASQGIIRGRPYGGVGFLWKNKLDNHVSIVDCEYDWMCRMKINNGGGREYYLINVYLPYDNMDELIDCFAKLGVFIYNINSTYITIVGDFNANLSRASLFGDLLLRFCDDNTLNIIDKEILPNDAYTYVSYSWGSTSWLGHVICTADAKRVTLTVDCALSDHHPVVGEIDLNIITACYSEVSNDIKQRTDTFCTGTL